MRVFATADELRAWRASAGNVGFVPTMGALHAGHLSLVERAVGENDAAVVSIFVNPTQFGPNEDYRSYPRTEERDLAMLETARVAAAFVPSVEAMYPPDDAALLDPGPIAAPLEGARRPGHFAGVVTVVAKLFDKVKPDIAYFGQKDFQQLRVLQALAADRYPWVQVVGCPIVRDPDGLAMSSRNAYLTADRRASALALSRGLFATRDRWASGERDPETLRAAVREVLGGEPRVALEYVSAADPITLTELTAPAERAVVSLAARVGNARLIDNVLLGMDLSDLE